MNILSKNISRFVTSVMLMIIVLTSVFYIGSTLLEYKFKRHLEYENSYTELINLLAITQEMRRREKDFFLRKDIIYAKQYDNLSIEAKTYLASIKKREGMQSFETDLSKLNGLLEKHHKEFLAAVLAQQTIGFDLDKGIQGTMRDYIHQLEDILVYKIKDKQLTIMLFTIRRNEKNFLLKMESAPDQPTPEVAKDFKVYLTKLQIDPALKKETLTLLDKYVGEFKRLVEKEVGLRKNMATLSSIFTDFEQIHYSLLNKCRDKSHQAESELGSFLLKFKYVMGLLAVLMIVLIGFSGRNLKRRFEP